MARTTVEVRRSPTATDRGSCGHRARRADRGDAMERRPNRTAQTSIGRTRSGGIEPMLHN